MAHLCCQQPLLIILFTDSIHGPTKNQNGLSSYTKPTDGKRVKGRNIPMMSENKRAYTPFWFSIINLP